jgi:hypothetical protein
MLIRENKRMEFDKRIKALTDIQSVTDGCHDGKLMNKKGTLLIVLLIFKISVNVNMVNMLNIENMNNAFSVKLIIMMEHLTIPITVISSQKTACYLKKNLRRNTDLTH